MDVLKDEDTVRIIRARSFREHSENTGETLRRVRSFKTTSKGLVNRGDSFETKRASPPNTIGYKGETLDITQNSIIAESDFPKLETTHSGFVHNYLRVLFTGAEGVGKSAIIDQFMTSEFLGYGSFNISQSEGERTVTLQVDGEESTLEFVQSEDFQDQDESFQIDGFVVVYCITERATFDIAIDLLKQIRDEVGSNKAIILVGNKSDLVRKRTISQEEGRSAADAYGCKYIELSAALNHRVDELLVGIHKQIKLKSDAENEELECKIPKGKERKSSFKRTKRFLEKVFLGHSGKDKKTENLYVD
ncbi:GTP-binding protein GEM-like isoform X7 [Ruditapes philippinarum]|uniref:GTP-binding protein GEM-like isoform X7 n=1 Tax=Ruditapes philippinarum TaxID=129788 RepID=UPI00295B7149|nr:GTP-binding protein GEM-like isoform X7 [Ruditapes philippinarum]